MSKANKIHIGTSGWNYDHWKGSFYPEELSSKKWLHFYAEKFKTVEINNSFYQLPAEETFKTWRDTSPEDFNFSVKASRYITHMKKLKNPTDALSNFLNRVEILGDKIGPILFQLPPRWKSNSERLTSFMELLPDDYRYTFEFRDSSWWNDEIYEILKKYNASFCIFELAGQMTPKEVTADFVYVRLHGPEDAYEGQYSDKTLKEWAKIIQDWEKQGKEVYCYFDNDQKGYAAQDGMRLQEMVK